MSHVTAAPNVLAASAGELAAIGSTMRAANAAAAAPTAGVLAAGGDDVSAGIAALFGARAQAYQAISAQAALFHDRFVQILQEGAAAYAMAEAANALPLQKAQGVVSELAQDRTGGTGTGQSRGAGGFGGVGQAGGKGWDGGPIGNGQVGEQHGAGQLGSTDGNPGVAGAAHGSGVSASHGSGAPGAAGVADPGGSGAGVGSAAGNGTGAGSADAVGGAGTGRDIVGSVRGDGGVGMASGDGGLSTGAAGASAEGGLMPGFGGAPWVGGHWGLGGEGHSGAIGGVGEQVAPAVATAPAVSPATTSAVAAESGSTPATKAQAMHATTNPGNAAHQGNPADPGNSARRADGGRDEQLLLLPLTSLRGLRHTLKKLSGLRARNGLLTASGDNASGSGRPWDRDQLLRALGLRPPGHE